MLLIPSLNQIWWILILLVIQIPLLYSISEEARWFIRMSLFYVTIFVAATFAAPLCVPSYFLNKGGSWAFATLDLCARWIDMQIEVRNKERLDSVQGPAIIIANHQSSLDVIPMAKCWPDKCTVIMKDSLKWVPVFNLCAYLCNTIFVKRFTQTGQGINPCIEKAINIMIQKDLKIWIFPEGARNYQHGLLPFRKGAFNIATQAQVPIIPVVISDYKPFYSYPKRYFRWPSHVIVQVLNPFPTTGLTIEDVPTLSEKIRGQMVVEYERISKEAALRHLPKDQQAAAVGEDKKNERYF